MHGAPRPIHKAKSTFSIPFLQLEYSFQETPLQHLKLKPERGLRRRRTTLVNHEWRQHSPPEGEVDEFELKEREIAEILASLVEFVSQETAGETPSVNNEDQCEEPTPAAKEDHVEVKTHKEKSPGKPDYVMELSDRLAGIEEGVAMANYRGARATAEVNPRAHFPPTSMVDITAVPSLDQETYQTAAIAGKGPVPRLGTIVEGKAASETSQTLKSKGEDCSQPEDSDDGVVIIKPPAKLMGSAIAAHARVGGVETGGPENWQGEVGCVKQEPKDAEPEVPVTSPKPYGKFS
ncbi:hypothetical protein PIB30_051174 [Stylosanthes scabra]|uniref:Uncharacterized protein n=1 Tax=Stylosanthes scabra TaxID=79078 RepID=A0ABU6UGH9_9FABA|nr:hypothetical protein [Stylosanthes scabra]